MPLRPVAIQAIAPITPIGIGAADFAQALREGRCGIDEIVGFDASDLAMQRAGEMQGFDLANYLASVKSYVDRASALALAAASIALRETGWQPSDEQPVGLVLGTEWGCIEAMELYSQKITTADPKFAPPFLFTQGYMNAPNSLVSIEFGLRGFNTCLSCGRTSGAAAIAYAFDQVRHGRAERLLAGGVDALSRVLCASLDGKLLGPLGEAAGLLALERTDGPVQLLGTGQAAGAHSVSEALAAATRDADMAAQDLDAIIAADGPGLTDTLSCELGDGMPKTVLLLEPLTGDTLGASGAVATCAATLMAQGKLGPPADRVGVVSSDALGSCVVLIIGRIG